MPYTHAWCKSSWRHFAQLVLSNTKSFMSHRELKINSSVNHCRWCAFHHSSRAYILTNSSACDKSCKMWLHSREETWKCILPNRAVTVTMDNYDLTGSWCSESTCLSSSKLLMKAWLTTYSLSVFKNHRALFCDLSEHEGLWLFSKSLHITFSNWFKDGVRSQSSPRASRIFFFIFSWSNEKRQFCFWPEKMWHSIMYSKDFFFF